MDETPPRRRRNWLAVALFVLALLAAIGRVVDPGPEQQYARDPAAQTSTARIWATADAQATQTARAR